MHRVEQLMAGVIVAAFFSVPIFCRANGVSEQPTVFELVHPVNSASVALTITQMDSGNALRLTPSNPLLASTGRPRRLKIPRISVDTAIEDVGLTPEGAMDVPSDPADAGWYDAGPRPGEAGNAVIAGHLNGERGEVGIFTNLHKLKKGDTVYVEDSNGTSTAFQVRESRRYKPGYAEEVFRHSDAAHLNLITCTGRWDETKKRYSERLVVFTDILP